MLICATDVLAFFNICLTNGPTAVQTLARVSYYFISYYEKKSKPVSLELSSNMCMYYAFGNHIYSLSSMSTLEVIFCFLYLCH